MPPFPSSATSTFPPATTRPTVPGPSLVPPPRPEPVRAERFHFLGTFVDGFTIASFIERLAHAVARDESLLVTNHNINSLTVLQHDPKFADLYDRAGAVFVDGQPVVALGRLFGAPVKAEHRVAVLDWIWPLFDRAEREGWRIVHLGGSRAVLEEVRAKVVRQHPRLSLTLVDGFFDPSDPVQNGAVLDEIRQARPTVLLVGMGMPRQEHWLQDNLDALPPTVAVTVGGILSFLGDERPTAPRWMGRLGIEWLFRLATEPRRLWRRYLVEPLALVPAVARELRSGKADVRR